MNRRKFIRTSMTGVLASSAPGGGSAQTRSVKSGQAERRVVGEGRENPIRTYVKRVPVYSYGSTYIYGESPDFIPGTKLQEANGNPITKIELKKSWELEDNMLGGDPPGLPRTEMMDRLQAPYLPVNLIDGDPETCWCSRGQGQPDFRPEWIRLDLPVETRIKAVVFRLRTLPYRVSWQIATPAYGLTPGRTVKAGGDGVPKNLSIKVSRDAWHWDTVFENENYIPPEGQKRLEFSFEPRPAKQLWIIGKDLPSVDCWGFAFSIAGVEVLDVDGNNVALASRGAGVTVSSTEATYAENRYLHDDLWATAWDLGLKWMRVAGWDSVLQWAYVEREKGKYTIDPRADQAITQAADNGINIIMSLCYGNWLYTPQGKRQWTKDAAEIMDLAGPPETEEALRAFVNFANFMGGHFKGRVKYFCIWNEPYAAPPYGWGDAKKFSDFVKRVVPAIKEADPEAKIAWPTALTSGPFLESCLNEGLAPLFDLTHADGGSIELSRKLWESHGFKGRYILWEWSAIAPYPKPSRELPYTDVNSTMSELEKAKTLARSAVTTVGKNMIFCDVEWYSTYQPAWDVGLFRNAFSADPLCPIQPQAAYYVNRNLCTILGGAVPATVEVRLSNKEYSFTTYGFKRNSEPMLAIWRNVGAKQKGREISTGTGFNLAHELGGYQGEDKVEDVRTDVTILNVQAPKAIAYDTLNGLQQELKVRAEEGSVVIEGLLVKDYPILILLQSRRADS